MIEKIHFSESQMLRFCIGDCPNTRGKAHAHRCSAKEFWETITSPRVKAICDKLIGIDDKKQRDEIKKNLPVFCFNTAVFRNNHRSNNDALPNGLAMFDIDGVDNPMEIHERIKSSYSELKIYLAHISASGKGLHFVYELLPGETIAEGNCRMGTAIGTTFDPACKDDARASFAVDVDKFLYIDWANLMIDYATIEKQNAMLDDCMKRTVIPEKKVSNAENIETADASEGPEVVNRDPSSTYDGVALADIWNSIVEQILGKAGAPTEGMRNNTLFKAAVLMRYVCDFVFTTLRANVETWGLPEEEVSKTLRSALEQKRSTADLAKVDKIVARLKHTSAKPDINNVKGNSRAIQAYNALPKMPDVKMPRLLQLLFKVFPERLKAQVFFVAVSMCGVLLTALRAKSGSRREEITILPVIVEGPLASGKSFIDGLAEMLLEPLFKEDEYQNAVFANWQSECESISSNKDKPKKPKNRSRLCYGDFTSAAINDMQMNTFQQICLIISEELDTIKRSCGNKLDNITDMLRKGFDGARTGQRRVGSASINGSTFSLINFIFGTTPNSRRKLLPNAEDGTVSRVIFTSMDPTPGQKSPQYRELTKKETAELQSIVDDLWKVGLKPEDEIAELERRLADKSQIVLASEQKIRNEIYVKMPRLNKMIEEFEQTRIEDFAITESVSADTYSHRIPQFMRRIGMILYWLYGQKETNDMLELTRWAGERILQELLDRYGNAYDDVYLDVAANHTSYKRLGHNLDCLQSLPRVFSRSEIRNYRLSHGLMSSRDEENCITVMISRMVKNGKIQKIAEDQWEQIA